MQGRVEVMSDHLTLLDMSSLTLTAGLRLEELVLCCHEPVLPVGLPGESWKMYSPSTYRALNVVVARLSRRA